MSLDAEHTRAEPKKERPIAHAYRASEQACCRLEVNCSNQGLRRKRAQWLIIYHDVATCSRRRRPRQTVAPAWASLRLFQPKAEKCTESECGRLLVAAIGCSLAGTTMAESNENNGHFLGSRHWKARTAEKRKPVLGLMTRRDGTRAVEGRQ